MSHRFPIVLITVALTLLLTPTALAQLPPVMDRIFILDGSDSVDDNDFAYQLAVMRRMLCGTDAPDYASGSVGIAVLQFSTTFELEFPYTEILSLAHAAAICDFLDLNATRMGGDSRLDIALDTARELFLVEGKSFTRQVFAMTDGAVSQPVLARAAAAALRQLIVPAQICITNTGLNCDVGIDDLKRICNTVDSDTHNPAEPIGTHACTFLNNVDDLVCGECSCRGFRPATPPKPGWVDQIFVIDGSGSVAGLFNQIQTTVARFVCEGSASSPSFLPYGVAVIQFNFDAQVEIDYQVINTPEEAAAFCDQMLQVPQLGGGTSIAAGLQVAFDLIETKAQAPIRHLLILGDGDTSNDLAAQQLADDLRNMPIPVRICAIEITADCFDQEPMMGLANDVNGTLYDPTLPDGNYACSGGDLSTLLICNNCMCGSICEDCSTNGVADACELVNFFNKASPVFAPFGNSGFAASHTFTGWPPPIDEVVLAFTANAPVGGSDTVTVFLNGINLGQIFLNGSNCPIPSVDTITLSAVDFNNLTPNGTALVEMRTADFLPTSCNDTTSINVVLSVATDIYGDINHNNVVDDCDRMTGDSDLDGEVGILDFLEVLGTWGPCLDPLTCNTDFDLDDVVGILDFLNVLANWGPVP